MLRGRPPVLATLKVEAEDEAGNRFSRSRTVLPELRASRDQRRLVASSTQNG